MIRDAHAVVWTRLSGIPVKMGELHVTESESRFVYELPFLQTGLPGLGLVLSPDIFAENTIRWLRTERFNFPPPIQSLIPPAGEHNFQRRLILNYLHTIGIQSGSEFENDWNILTFSGHGGIGHVDVFSSDDKARHWYAIPTMPQQDFLKKKSSLGFSLKNMLTWYEDETGYLLDFIGPTPSVNGAIPKLLLSIPRTGWNGQVGLPTRFGDTQSTDIILKLEKDTAYPGIVELEALGLDIHRQAGFATPRYWVTEFEGIHALAIERFDRDEQNIPVFQESLFSVLASGNRNIQNHYDASYDQLGRMFDNPRLTLIEDRKSAKKHLLKRLLLSFLTGNGDLHLENLSLQIRNGQTDFSPVYDPVPMRAYSIHNILSAMPFGHYGDYTAKQNRPRGFTQAVKAFNQSLGFDKNQLSALIDELLSITDNFAHQVNALKSLPQENRKNLIRIHDDIKHRLSML